MESQGRGVDANEYLEDIEKHGFHITDARVRITECNLIHRCSTSGNKMSSPSAGP
jgi:hypothetical protein